MKPIRVYRNALAKLITVGPRGWILLVRAKLALVAAQLDVWRREKGDLVDASSAASQNARPERKADAERIAVAVRRAATYGLVTPTCLVRSLAICRLLRSSGIPGGQIRVGVALRNGTFVAHAWVEYAGTVIGDDDDVARRYTTLDELKVVAGD